MDKKTVTLNKIQENLKHEKEMSISATKEYHEDAEERDLLVKQLI